MVHKIHYLANMKNKISWRNGGRLLVVAVLFSAFLLGGATRVQARDGNHDRGEYGSENGNFHHHHRGHWSQSNGVRLWINVG
jgi:hypothetical protein